MSGRVPPIQVGDIVLAALPEHHTPGEPGPEFRYSLVLGLEVEPHSNSLEGLWLVRLSERTNICRSWDYKLQASSLFNVKSPGLECDHIIRTSRIDLIPNTERYICKHLETLDPIIAGSIRSTVWDELALQLQKGRLSGFDTDSIGPRPQLYNTVVKISMNDETSFHEFDCATIADMVSLPQIDIDREGSLTHSFGNMCKDTPENRRTATFSRQFYYARREQAQQEREKAIQKSASGNRKGP